MSTVEVEPGQEPRQQMVAAVINRAGYIMPHTVRSTISAVEEDMIELYGKVIWDAWFQKGGCKLQHCYISLAYDRDYYEHVPDPVDPTKDKE